MDAAFAEIVVIVDVAYEERLPEAVAMLEQAGMTVSSADDENSVINGQVELSKRHALEQLRCVEYVRTVFTYHANFPPGDPRDRDGS